MSRAKSTKIVQKSKTTKTTKVVKTAKKTKKTETILEVVPNKVPVDTLITTTKGISINNEMIAQISSTKNNILRLKAEVLEGKLIKILSEDQYFHPASCQASKAEDMLNMEFVKLSDNSKVKIDVAPDQIFYNLYEQEVKAQDLVTDNIIRGQFSNFKLVNVHIYKNKDDRVLNFKILDGSPTYVLGCGIITKCEGIE